MAVWFITGAARGLGLALTETVLAAGHTVVGASRSGVVDAQPSAGKLHVVELDVTDPAGPERAVGEAVELSGGLDVVVNNAGFGLLGAVEETTDDELAAVLDVNLVGPTRLIRAALPHLRRRGGGVIVNVSSIAALDPLPGSAVYAAAKAGLSALSDGLAAELDGSGIEVMSVEPGGFRTEFLSDRSVRRTASTIDAYSQTSGAAVEHMRQRAGRQAGDPRRAAQLIVDAVGSATVPRHLVLGRDAIDRTKRHASELLSDVEIWETRSAATNF